MSKLTRIDPDLLRGNPRATYSAWLRYEPIVSAAFAKHPLPYIYSPTSLAAVTVVTRLRDAIRGAIAFGHPSVHEISTDDLARWYSEVVIKSDQGQVYIGPPKTVSDAIRGHVANEGPSFRFDTLSLEETIAFTVLLSSNRLRGPVSIAHPVDISLLPERPNIELMAKPDGSLVIL